MDSRRKKVIYELFYSYEIYFANIQNHQEIKIRDGGVQIKTLFKFDWYVICFEVPISSGYRVTTSACHLKDIDTRERRALRLEMYFRMNGCVVEYLERIS